MDDGLCSSWAVRTRYDDERAAWCMGGFIRFKWRFVSDSASRVTNNNFFQAGGHQFTVGF